MIERWQRKVQNAKELEEELSYLRKKRKIIKVIIKIK